MNYLVTETTDGEKKVVGVLMNVYEYNPKEAIKRSLEEISYHFDVEVQESDCDGFEGMGLENFEVTIKGGYAFDFVEITSF